MPNDLLHSLKDYFGFDRFRGPQQKIIQSVLNGNDTFVLMPTGGGKSLCYQLPALLLEGTTVVISPLIALMKNQVDMLRSSQETDNVAHFMNSSLTKKQIEQVKADVCAGRTKLLYVAPESLAKRENIVFFKEINISFYAVDEAHCISEWGHDFRPEYRNIRALVEEINPRPIIALTATATPNVQRDILRSLGMKDAKIFQSSFNRDNLHYEIRPKKADTDKEVVRFIKANAGKSGIIYCLSRKKVEEFAELLVANDIKARPYHAGIDAQIRAENQDAFVMERAEVIVATIAFGMGIDKPDVRYVIHYDMPKSIEGYYQETGRAGRDGGEGRCIAYYCDKDITRMQKLISSKTGAELEVGKLLLAEMVNFAESSLCRRKLLLHYFGEEYNKDNCERCDNCLKPKKRMEAQELLLSILELMSSMKEKVKEELLIDIIRGRNTAEVETNNLNDLELFGAGSSEPERIWHEVVHQAIIAGYIEKVTDKFGLLKVTKSGNKYIDSPKPFTIILEDDSEEEDEEAPIGSNTGGAMDPVIFGLMKDLRSKLSKRLEVPPYVIFQDPTLESMASVYPITIEELANVPGVGVGKAKRYGEEFVAMIKKYVKDNEIERPEDFRVKTVANRSMLKVAIIQGIDRHASLDDIAQNNGLDFEELLDELEAVVFNGTKVNIDYFLTGYNEPYMDEESVEEIYDYFKESKTDSLDEAMEELGAEFTDIEIRLVRIKFISEMGN